MNKWIKPSELPNDFWAECFVSVYEELGIFTELNYIKKVNNVAFWYSSTEQEWFRLRDDTQVRVIAVEYPTITEEDFK